MGIIQIKKNSQYIRINYNNSKKKLKRKNIIYKFSKKENGLYLKKYLLILLIFAFIFIILYSNNNLFSKRAFEKIKIINEKNKININKSINKTNNNNFNKIGDFPNIKNFIFKDKDKEIKIESENDFLSLCKEKEEKEIVNIYFDLCKKEFLFDNTTYQKVKNPKISIIIIAMNREKYIMRILRSIQNQPMKDIEIIFVDDGSSDKTVQLIEHFQEYDERIILIKHEINKGSLISRNEGAYKANGEYLLYADSDDLLLYNILDKTYETAKKGDFEIVQFAVYRRTPNGYLWNYGEKRNNTPIYQPKLSSLMYYYRGYLRQTDWHLWGKLIKKEAFYRTLESIDNYYLNSNMSINEDGLVDFMLLKKGKSFIYIKDYGYVYTINTKGMIFSLNKIINKAIKDYFLYLKFLFENTQNNEYEKSMAGAQLKYVYNRFLRNFKNVTENFPFLYEILNLYINCPYINRYNKKRAKIIFGILNEAEKNLKEKNNTKIQI